MATYTEHDNYTEIVCSSNETFSKTLSQGETWSNILLDITATGASYDIHSGGNSNWTIQNFGIRGQIDADGAPTQQNFIVYDPSSSGNSVIQNVYLPGTSYSRGNPENFPSGIFVYTGHAGDLEVNNFYAVDLPSHALYGSTMAPSNGGSGGTVRVHDSYCADTENSGWRLGSPGSYADNCVAFRTVRGVWARWDGPIEVRNSDMGDNGTDLITADGGSIEAIDTRYGSRSGNVTGASVGTPQEYVPSGCPTSALEAATGDSGGTEPTPSPSGDPLVSETFAHSDLSTYYEGNVNHFAIGDTTSSGGDDSGGDDGGGDGSTDVVVLEDFEWGGTDAITDYYTGNTSNLDVQQSVVLEGNWTLQSAEYYRTWWDGSGTTPRGYEYVQDFQMADAKGNDNIQFYYSVPDSHSVGGPDSGYYVYVGEDADAIEIRDAADDSTIVSETATINAGTHYQIGFRYGETGTADNLQAVLYDASGSALASTPTATDDSYTGGKHGWYFGHAYYVDNLRQRSL